MTPYLKHVFLVTSLTLSVAATTTATNEDTLKVDFDGVDANAALA